MMTPQRKLQWLLAIMMGVALGGSTGMFVLARLAHAEAEQALGVNFPLPQFTLTNQDAQPITLADLRGQVWVGDIVFTRCQGPCPVITKHLSELQSELPKNSPVKLVTLTTDPEFDTPEVMKHFGERFGAHFENWYFLTGDKMEIVRLAVDGLKLTAIEKSPAQRETPADLFIHSTRFVVVDKQGVMRASYDSNESQVNRKIVKLVRKLLKE
jgi:protein SCO1